MLVIRNYELLKELGRGSFGVTFLGRNTKTGQKVAVKTINISESSRKNVGLASILEEINTLKDLTGTGNCYEYIACYFDSFRDFLNGQDTIFIISEYIDGIDLGKFMEINKDGLDPGFLWPIMLQLILGLKYIHSRDYAHRDIKPENILITRDFKIKYIDFGLACMQKCRSGSGTLFYMPPEFFNGTSENSMKASQAHDIWSLGVVFFNLTNGYQHFPFDTKYLDENHIMKNISSSPKYTAVYNFDDDHRTENFVNRILINDWVKRPKITYILSDLLKNVLAKVWVSEC